jgi:hypothetical protein
VWPAGRAFFIFAHFSIRKLLKVLGSGSLFRLITSASSDIFGYTNLSRDNQCPFKIESFSSETFRTQMALKGTVQRKLTWEKSGTGINQQLMTCHCSDGYIYFLI